LNCLARDHAAVSPTTLNNGTINVLAGSTIDVTPANFTNAGAVTVDATGGASQFTITGTYPQTGGSTPLVAGGILNSTNSTVNISGGALQGTGDVGGNVTNGNTATLSPGTATNAG
jgi:hypothetical protein